MNSVNYHKRVFFFFIVFTSFCLSHTCSAMETVEDLVKDRCDTKYLPLEEQFPDALGSLKLIDPSPHNAATPSSRPSTPFAISLLICKENRSRKSRCYRIENSRLYEEANTNTGGIITLRASHLYKVPTCSPAQVLPKYVSKWDLQVTVTYKVFNVAPANYMEVTLRLTPKGTNACRFVKKRVRESTFHMRRTKDDDGQLFHYPHDPVYNAEDTRNIILPMGDGTPLESSFPKFRIIELHVLRCREDVPAPFALAPSAERRAIPDVLTQIDPKATYDQIKDSWLAHLRSEGCGGEDALRFETETIRYVGQGLIKNSILVFPPADMTTLLADPQASVFPVLFQRKDVEDTGGKEGNIRLKTIYECFSELSEKPAPPLLRELMSALVAHENSGRAMCHYRENTKLEPLIYIHLEAFVKEKAVTPYIFVYPRKFTEALRMLASMNVYEVVLVRSDDNVKYEIEKTRSDGSKQRCRVHSVNDFTTVVCAEDRDEQTLNSDKSGTVIYDECSQERRPFARVKEDMDLLYQPLVDGGWMLYKIRERAIAMCVATVHTGKADLDPFLLTKATLSKASDRDVNFALFKKKYEFSLMGNCYSIAFVYMVATTAAVVNAMESNAVIDIAPIASEFHSIFNGFDLSRPRQGTVHESETERLARDLYTEYQCCPCTSNECTKKHPDRNPNSDTHAVEKPSIAPATERPCERNILESYNSFTGYGMSDMVIQYALFGESSLDGSLYYAFNYVPSLNFKRKITNFYQSRCGVNAKHLDYLINLEVFRPKGNYKQVAQFIFDHCQNVQVLLTKERKTVVIPVFVRFKVFAGIYQGHALTIICIVERVVESGTPTWKLRVRVIDSIYFAVDFVPISNANQLSEELERFVDKFLGPKGAKKSIFIYLHYPTYTNNDISDVQREHEYMEMTESLKSLNPTGQSTSSGGSNGGIVSSVLERVQKSFESVESLFSVVGVIKEKIEKVNKILSLKFKYQRSEDADLLKMTFHFIFGEQKSILALHANDNSDFSYHIAMSDWKRDFSQLTAQDAILHSIQSTIRTIRSDLDFLSTLYPDYGKWGTSFTDYIPLYLRNVYAHDNSYENYANNRFSLPTVAGHFLEPKGIEATRKFIKRQWTILFDSEKVGTSLGELAPFCRQEKPWQRNPLHIELLLYLVTKSLVAFIRKKVSG